jgi:catechol 2,3-dioxygenase-like lactoylglutathione lyase family enzyme
MVSADAQPLGVGVSYPRPGVGAFAAAAASDERRAVATQLSATEALRRVNGEIGDAEQKHEVDRLKAILHDDLIFRRADGTVVNRAQYLAAVPTRDYDMLSSDVVEVDVREGSAIVTVLVTAVGSANGKPFAGTFRNTRMFVSVDGEWRCRLWLNARAGMDATSVHHVSLSVRDLERSKSFYREILGLTEIDRPAFDFQGAWYQLGDGELHLIVNESATFRDGKGVDSRDVHFALRVRSYREALELLQSKGYREDADDLETMKMEVSSRATAGFPQLYIIDPDRHVIELNAERLDR